MRPAHVVEIRVTRRLRFHLGQRAVGMRVDVIVFHDPLEQIDEDFVDPSALVVHVHMICVQRRRKVLIG